MAKRLTEERIEKMAVEIRAFLLEHGIWQDTDIYFNGKRFTTRDPETKKYYYNDPEKLFVEDNQNPRDYFEYELRGTGVSHDKRLRIGRSGTAIQ